VGVFPEGTTGLGDTVMPFHANLLQAAISTATPVQPAVLRYSQPGRPVSEAAQYVGDTTLVGSVLKLVRARGVVVHVSFLDPVPPGEASRRALAPALQAIVAARLAKDLARPG
jgi:1-acyl-sn-glycerol-3-phosphate acyltransferase